MVHAMEDEVESSIMEQVVVSQTASWSVRIHVGARSKMHGVDSKVMVQAFAMPDPRAAGRFIKDNMDDALGITGFIRGRTSDGIAGFVGGFFTGDAALHDAVC